MFPAGFSIGFPSGFSARFSAGFPHGIQLDYPRGFPLGFAIFWLKPLGRQLINSGAVSCTRVSSVERMLGFDCELALDWQLDRREQTMRVIEFDEMAVQPDNELLN